MNLVSPLLKILLWLPMALSPSSLCRFQALDSPLLPQETSSHGEHSPASRLWFCLLRTRFLPPHCPSHHHHPAPGYLLCSLQVLCRFYSSFCTLLPVALLPVQHHEHPPDPLDCVFTLPAPTPCFTPTGPMKVRLTKRKQGREGGGTTRRRTRTFTHLYCSLACIMTKSHL